MGNQNAKNVRSDDSRIQDEASGEDHPEPSFGLRRDADLIAAMSDKAGSIEALGTASEQDFTPIPAECAEISAELRKLLELCSEIPDAEERVPIVNIIFELLLRDHAHPLMEMPAFREATITKAYEFIEHPALTWTIQRFLLEYYPEGLDT